jgi:hypothetical protein
VFTAGDKYPYQYLAKVLILEKSYQTGKVSEKPRAWK